LFKVTTWLTDLRIVSSVAVDVDMGLELKELLELLLSFSQATGTVDGL